MGQSSLFRKITCIQSPLPKITWYKNNVTIPSPNNVTKDEVTSELVIDQFQTSIQTQYTCVARNEYNDEVKTSTKLGRAHVLLKSFLTELDQE